MKQDVRSLRSGANEDDDVKFQKIHFLLEGFLPSSDNPYQRMSLADPAIESILCRAANAGDRVAWQRLYDSVADRLNRFAHWRSGGHADLADDALQDAWLTIAKSLAAFDPKKGSFETWAIGITANAIRNRLRSRQRKTYRELTGDEPSREATHDKALRVAEALASLPEEYELVLRGKYFDRFTVVELAIRTKETEKAIESRLTRARAAFREQYGDDHG